MVTNTRPIRVNQKLVMYVKSSSAVEGLKEIPVPIVYIGNTVSIIPTIILRERSCTCISQVMIELVFNKLNFISSYFYEIFVIDCKGNRHNLTLLQYISPDPAGVVIKPHGNAKSSEPYLRRSKSTLHAIKNEV